MFETLWRRRERMHAADAVEVDRLVATLRANEPDIPGILAFNDRLTPSFVDDVTKVRRSFRMAANARNGR